MGFLRTLAGILLLVSILTLVPIGRAVIRILNGGQVGYYFLRFVV